MGCSARLGVHEERCPERTDGRGGSSRTLFLLRKVQPWRRYVLRSVREETPLTLAAFSAAMWLPPFFLRIIEASPVL